MFDGIFYYSYISGAFGWCKTVLVPVKYKSHIKQVVVCGVCFYNIVMTGTQLSVTFPTK